MSQDPRLLQTYLRRFCSVRRYGHPRRGRAPHKPLLLLALLDGVERGHVRENRVALTPALVASFRCLWRALVPEGTWSDQIAYPFRHLAGDGFWELVRDGEPVPEAALGSPSTVGQLARLVDWGRFAPDLWELLQDPSARAALRAAVLDAYFPASERAQAADAVADPLAREAERLIAEAARTPFRTRPLPRVQRESDAAYVRHHLFPSVVTGLYRHACAVCRVGVRDESGRALVDAAHVMPFARFGNDDPRNGLALCPNHHRGYDAGWFTVTEGLQVRVSPRLRGGAATVGGDAEYVRSGAAIIAPADARYAPAHEALAWHAEHVFQR